MTFPLGIAAIERLIPHRPPFLMVDTIVDYAREPAPRLRASRTIHPDEPIFAGHFPGHHLWPGAYTIEGLSQACLLVRVLHDLETRAGALAPVLAALAGGAPIAGLPLGDAPLGMTGAIEIRLERPVHPGDRLDYLVTQTHAHAHAARFTVRAEVSAHRVARGHISGVTSLPRA